MTSKFLIFLGLLFVLPSYGQFLGPADQHSQQVFVIEEYWHTGIVFEVDSSTRATIPALNDFDWADYVDIGWGDEDFYQNPDIDILLGAKAILVPTSSVVRVEGFRGKAIERLQRADTSFSFRLSNSQFEKLLRFIRDSFTYGSDGNPVIKGKQLGDRVIFYASPLPYHLFNTCNTWVGKAFRRAGFDVSTTWLITKDQLSERLGKLTSVRQ